MLPEAEKRSSVMYLTSGHLSYFMLNNVSSSSCSSPTCGWQVRLFPGEKTEPQKARVSAQWSGHQARAGPRHLVRALVLNLFKWFVPTENASVLCLLLLPLCTKLEVSVPRMGARRQKQSSTKPAASLSWLHVPPAVQTLEMPRGQNRTRPPGATRTAVLSGSEPHVSLVTLHSSRAL